MLTVTINVKLVTTDKNVLLVLEIDYQPQTVNAQMDIMMEVLLIVLNVNPHVPNVMDTTNVLNA